jgi:hypothetical protein
LTFSQFFAIVLLYLYKNKKRSNIMLKESMPSAYSPAESTLNSPEDNGAVWSYTSKAEDIALLRQQQERERGVKERHTISRDSKISGGVYEGAYGGEAIVVDTEKYPLINQAVEQVIEKITVGGRIDKGLVLETVYRYVLANMRYDSAAVDKIFAEDCKGTDGQKISIDVYIGDGVGECRHQALFAGAILEQLAERGIVGGRASVERNLVKHGPDGKYDGHSWVRYTNSADTVYVLDIAQHKLDTLDNLMQDRRNSKDVWDYARKEDHERIRGLLTLDAVSTSGWAESISTNMQQPVVIDTFPGPVEQSRDSDRNNTSEHHDEQELRAVRASLVRIADQMKSGTVDGYILAYSLRDEGRKLQFISHELSTDVGGLADEVERQAGSRYGFSSDLVVRVRNLSSRI